MTASNNKIPKGVDPNDPLLWFNPEALGVNSNQPAKNTKVAKKHSFQKSSPKAKLDCAVSGRPKHYKTTKSGIIKSSEGVGQTLLMTSAERVHAAGHNATLVKNDHGKFHWHPNFMAKSYQAGQGTPTLRRTDSQPVKAPAARMAAGRQTAPKEAKVPEFELRPSGLGHYENPFSMSRTREFTLHLLNFDRENS
jgi:hypothetical protein